MGVSALRLASVITSGLHFPPTWRGTKGRPSTAATGVVRPLFTLSRLQANRTPSEAGEMIVTMVECACGRGTHVCPAGMTHPPAARRTMIPSLMHVQLGLSHRSWRSSPTGQTRRTKRQHLRLRKQLQASLWVDLCPPQIQILKF